MVFEDLESMPKASFTAYKYVEQTHQIYSEWDWKGLSEGEVSQMKKFSSTGILPSKDLPPQMVDSMLN